MAKKRSGTVVGVEERTTDQLVQVQLEDGELVEVAAPAMLLIEPGMPVTETGTGDDAPIYAWG